MAESQRKPGSWMQLPIDDRILEVLDLGLTLNPTIIAENIDKSRPEVNKRLTRLSEVGLVVRVRKGRYKISDIGRGYLVGELDASDMDSDET